MEDASQNPGKSGEKTQKRRSLSFKVTRSVAISCILFGMLIQLISINMYGVILLREYKRVDGRNILRITKRF